MDEPVITQPLSQPLNNISITPITNNTENNPQLIANQKPKNTIFKKVIIILISILVIIIALFFTYVFISRPQYNPDILNSKGNKYPDAMTVPIMQNCKIGKENCQCVLDYLQENYSYNEIAKDEDNGYPLLTEAANYCKSLAN